MQIKYISSRIFEIKKNFALFRAANKTPRPPDRREPFALLDRRNSMKGVDGNDHRARRELKFLFSGRGLNDQRAALIGLWFG